MEYAFILLFLYASYLSIEKYVHTGSVLKWRGGQRPASGLPVKEEPAEPREETSEEAVIGRSRYRLWQSPPMDEEYAMSEKRTDTAMKEKKVPVPEFPAPFGRPEEGEVPERYEITGYVERPDPHRARGVTFDDMGFMGGATNKRCHRPTGGAAVGPEVVKTLDNAVQARKIDLRTESQVVDLIQNKKGAVVGVKVKNLENGKVYTINTKAVVNAAGGFGANNALVSKIVPRLKGFATTNHPGATGDGLLLSEKIGAAFVDLPEIQTHPTFNEQSGIMVTEAVRGNGAVLINMNGKRFYDELSTRDKVSAAILKQPTSHAYLFFDESVRKSLKAIEGYVKRPGMVLQGKTLEEIAGKMKVPADALKATMAQYAKDQAAGKDSCCGRTKMERPLNQPGYYAIVVTPAVHHTMGGLKIDTKAQVYNFRGQVIPGYFAAGEVTGGVHGGNRLGGNAQADIIVYGRIAGQSATAYAKAH